MVCPPLCVVQSRCMIKAFEFASFRRRPPTGSARHTWPAQDWTVVNGHARVEDDTRLCHLGRCVRIGCARSHRKGGVKSLLHVVPALQKGVGANTRTSGDLGVFVCDRLHLAARGACFGLLTLKVGRCYFLKYRPASKSRLRESFCK